MHEHRIINLCLYKEVVGPLKLCGETCIISPASCSPGEVTSSVRCNYRMAFLTANKRSIVSLQLAFTILFLVSALILVAHARDIRSSRRNDIVMEKGVAASSVLQDAEVVESSDVVSSSRSRSRSSNAFETKQKQENRSGTAAAEGTDDDFLVVDYTPARKKSPIHN